MTHVLQGFLVGMAYLAPIGTQNLYVIRHALSSRWPTAAKVALWVALVDITLALACFYGMSAALAAIPHASVVLTFGGAAFLLYLGAKLMRHKTDVAVDASGAASSGRTWVVLRDACAISWLNPQALVDGSVLFGSIQANVTRTEGFLVLGGVGIASVCWFQILTGVLSMARDKVTERVWTWINRACGMGLILFALKLLYDYAHHA